MEYREWDMYDYILESKAAVRNIVAIISSSE